MDKEVLKQYADMREEEADLKRRIQSLNDKILNLEMRLTVVSDSVTTGRHNKKPIQTVKIQGIPKRELELINKKKGEMIRLKSRLSRLDADMMEKMNDCEDYIGTIEDSWIRQALRYRFVDGLPWAKIGSKMHSTPDSIRMAVERFLDKEVEDK